MSGGGLGHLCSESSQGASSATLFLKSRAVEEDGGVDSVG
jgi:hypothetical protein